jgi:hypothetical protein
MYIHKIKELSISSIHEGIDERFLTCNKTQEKEWRQITKAYEKKKLLDLLENKLVSNHTKRDVLQDNDIQSFRIDAGGLVDSFFD